MAKTSTKRHFVVCVRNEGYEVSLERRKIYVSIDDDDAQAHKLIRVIDESGEDYLYPQAMFLPINLPQSIRRVQRPNHAFERTHEKRPWLRNDHRCARAAQRGRWAAKCGSNRSCPSHTDADEPSFRHARHIAARSSAGPEISSRLAGGAASLLTLNCQ